MDRFAVAISGIAVCARVAAGAPDFGPNVHVFDPSMKDAQARVDAIFSQQESAQFGTGRHALLFKPGKYDLDVQVGFYTQATGLGAAPDDVTIHGAVRSTAGWMKGNATCNFWRAAENLSITPPAGKPNVWAVSQGASLRRVHVRGDLHLWDGGWSSGGFLSDSRIDGRVVSGSQQQWMSRNVEWRGWDGGVWNMVFVGVKSPPAGKWPERPMTTIARTPIVREKPFLAIDAKDEFVVRVPALHRDLVGVAPAEGGTAIAMDACYIAHSDRDDSASINAALDAGKHLVLTPGIYHLKQPLNVTRPGTVVLGIGFPTLIPDEGEPAMTIADVDGVKLAGVVFDAGEKASPTLLRVGEKGGVSHASDPICLFDIVARAGGATPGTAHSFVTIRADDVIGDNLWLWRADHGAFSKWNENRVENGLIVEGDRATIYGLFVEHTQGYQTLWNGNGGRVYFYQSEMPYDPPGESEWSHDGVAGFASYKVGDGVTTHEAYGLGVYSLLNDAPIVAARAFEAPDSAGVKLKHLVAIRLGGHPGSGIAHVLNDRGEPVVTQMKSTLDE